MTDTLDDDCEVIRGSGNVFRDFGHPDADREQLRAILAARIIGVLDDRKLTVRDAHTLTGIAAADFSRIRRVNLGRFTIDRLMMILSRLGQEVEVSVSVHPRVRREAAPPVAHP
jgi:predicted XRE-type DNA-binding protein